VLGAQVLFVLGHTSCGAVAATMKGDPVPGQISTLYQHIRPAVKAAGGSLDVAIVNNVKNQAEILAEASPVIGELVKEGKLLVAGGVYDLNTGRVTPVAL
jgi:carbonic anhydrase